MEPSSSGQQVITTVKTSTLTLCLPNPTATITSNPESTTLTTGTLATCMTMDAHGLLRLLSSTTESGHLRQAHLVIRWWLDLQALGASQPFTWWTWSPMASSPWDRVSKGEREPWTWHGTMSIPSCRVGTTQVPDCGTLVLGPASGSGRSHLMKQSIAWALITGKIVTFLS